MRPVLLTAAMLALGLPAAPAAASELFTGVLAHDVDTPLGKGVSEDGADLQFGWRGARIAALRPIGSPSPYVFGSVAPGAETHFAAAGLSWRIGRRLFVRPGLGLAVHTRGRGELTQEGLRTDFGSRLLFAPEFGIGYQMSERLSLEAAWVHLSHAQLLDRQNPGMDSIGVRLSYRLR